MHVAAGIIIGGKWAWLSGPGLVGLSPHSPSTLSHVPPQEKQSSDYVKFLGLKITQQVFVLANDIHRKQF